MENPFKKFTKGGSSSSPELGEESVGFRAFKVYNVYKQLFKTGLFKTGEAKDMADISGSELDSAIQDAWEKVEKTLKDDGFNPTEQDGVDFRAKLYDTYGTKHVGFDN